MKKQTKILSYFLVIIVVGLCISTLIIEYDASITKSRQQYNNMVEEKKQLCELVLEERIENINNSPFIFPHMEGEINYNREINQLTILHGKVSIEEISEAFGDTVIERIANDEFLLKSSIRIRNGGFLSIRNVDLKLDATSRAKRYIDVDWNSVDILSTNGSIEIINSTVIGWENGSPSEYVSGTMRPNIIIKGYENVNNLLIQDSELSYLGTNRGNRWGLSVYGKHSNIQILNTKIHDNFRGFYAFEVDNILFLNNEVYNNTCYGVDLHDYSNGGLYLKNEIYMNGNHGLIFSIYCNNNVISENSIYNHQGNAYNHNWLKHGVMLHEESNHNVVFDNTIENCGNGIQFDNSSNNLIMGNTIANSSKHGIRLFKGKSNTIVNNNIVNSSNGYDYRLELTRENYIYLSQGSVSIKDSELNKVYSLKKYISFYK